MSSCMHAKSLQSCLTLCDPMDYTPPCSSVQGIFQARILEWVAIPSLRGSSQAKDGAEPLGKPHDTEKKNERVSCLVVSDSL